MAKYIVVTKIPSRQGFVGPVPEKITIDEIEVEGDNAIDKIKNGLNVPLDGYCLIVRKDDVTKVTSKIVNNIEPES